jgi:preprotein translocase subunit SecY
MATRALTRFGTFLETILPKQLTAIFIIPELRQKILLTLLFLAIYRIGYHIPLPFVDQAKMYKNIGGGSPLGDMLGFVSMFSGGNLSQATIFGFGIMPYISASIIFQLLAAVYPPLEKIQKEGESGRKKINEWTRYLTVGICILQTGYYVWFLMGPPPNNLGWGIKGYDSVIYMMTNMLIMTTGTIFLMWLGEQIDEYGIGNGISLIIMAGIIARIPAATSTIFFEGTSFRWSVFRLGGSNAQDISFEKLIVLIALFVVVVLAVVAITKAQRRIPTQSAKHVRGRRVFGGTRQFLPLKVNQAGVMPVIFASSILVIPGLLFGFIASNKPDWAWASVLHDVFLKTGQGYWYTVLYIAMIFVFCYFWTAIIFNPKDMANNLKDYGSFIPGYRPGKRTAEYLEKVMIRITYVGAAFLAVVAVIPTLVTNLMHVPWTVASFYGGTGLLIVISVALDLVQKINSHLVMRNYPGLTED